MFDRWFNEPITPEVVIRKLGSRHRPVLHAELAALCEAAPHMEPDALIDALIAVIPRTFSHERRVIASMLSQHGEAVIPRVAAALDHLNDNPGPALAFAFEVLNMNLREEEVEKALTHFLDQWYIDMWIAVEAETLVCALLTVGTPEAIATAVAWRASQRGG
jgi:hypothetical protein